MTSRLPFLSIGLHEIRRFLRLPWRRRLDLLRAAAWLLAVDLGLRTVGFAAVRRVLRRLGRAPRPRGTGAADGVGVGVGTEAEALGWTVTAAARHHLYPMRCLPRSLVLQTLLARRGIPSALRIGVQTGEDGLEAHAWVEHEGRPLGESADPTRTFATLELPPR
ncbi:MAG: lasso peptide biosynthesis B2 protein [Acidobacteriota bacterium]|jgi:hypothetical protein